MPALVHQRLAQLQRLLHQFSLLHHFKGATAQATTRAWFVQQDK
jgi:hypothetical protein